MTSAEIETFLARITFALHPLTREQCETLVCRLEDDALAMAWNGSSFREQDTDIDGSRAQA